MKKSIFTAAVAIALAVSPFAAFAQDAGTAGSSHSDQMKGPPNANGMASPDSSTSGRSTAETNGAADTHGAGNGAAAAKSTGAAGDAGK